MDDILYYNPVFYTAISVYAFVLLLYCGTKAFQITQSHIKKGSSEIDLGDNAVDKTNRSLGLNILILAISTIVVICFIFSVNKLGIIGRLVSVLLMAKPILMTLSGVVEGIDTVHKEIRKKNNKDISYIGKTKLLFTLMGIDLIIIHLRDYKILFTDKNFGIQGVNDFYIVLMVALWYYYFAFQLLCIIGITVEILSILIKRISMGKLHFYKKKSFENYDFTVMIRNCFKKIKNIKLSILRTICFCLEMPIVLIFSVVYCSLMLLKELFEDLVHNILNVGKYLMRFTKSIYVVIGERGDKQYVWFCVRFSIIIAITITVIIFNRHQVINESSLRVFMFVAESLVIPLVITELLRAKEIFGDSF